MKLKLGSIICFIYGEHKWNIVKGRKKDAMLCDRCGKLVAAPRKPETPIQIKRTRGKSK